MSSFWQAPQKAGGIAFAGGANESYDDSAAWLEAVGFGPDQVITATIALAPSYSPTDPHEVELLLRASEPEAGSIAAYECLYGINSGSAYVQIMRWDGAGGTTYFTEITDPGVNNPFPQDGDQIEASIIGSDIVFRHIRGATETVLATATDAAHSAGSPGISFFMRPGGTLSSYGYAAVEASTL
ncbi:MAG: hypothetical protein KF788_08810 [Piscinibacter sp.]|nr:hypothetical protein [Piscinibacter sp.]